MPRGGKRANAGRPVGSGLYGEQTKPLRVPASLLAPIKRFIDSKTHFFIPLFLSKVQAGFPSPADDYQEQTIDLNEHLIQHPASTFCVRVTGDSMLGAGIYPNDLLIVDKSLPVVSGKIVVAIVNGDFTVKRIEKKGKALYLMPENDEFKPIEMTEENEAMIWGVVTQIIHSV